MARKRESASERSLNHYRKAVSQILLLAKHNHHIYRFIYQPYPKPCKPEHYAKAQQFFSTVLIAARVYVYRDAQTKEPMIVQPDWIKLDGGTIEYSEIIKDRVPDIKELVCYGDKMFNDRHLHFPLAPAIHLLRKFTLDSDHVEKSRKKLYSGTKSGIQRSEPELEDLERDFLDALKIDVTPFADLTEAFLKEYYPKDYGDQPSE